MLERTGIIELFDLITTNQDVKNAKPDPEGYLLTLEHFNVKKEDTVIVEDSPKGMAAARASGCRVIQVKGPNEVNVDLIRSYINESINPHGG